MVTSSYPKHPGDVTAPFIESIALAVAGRGHSVDLVLPRHPQLRRGADEPVRFYPYRYAPDAWSRWGYAQSLASDVRVRPSAYLLLPLAAAGLRAAVGARLAAARYDVMHVHWLVPNAALVQDIARTHGVPLVVSLHGSDVFVAERLWPARILARRALGQAGAVTACSSDLRERALALGARPARTRTLPYGVDLEAFRPERGDAGWRSRLGLPAGELLVLACGRLVEKKGFRQLVEAAARAPGIQLVIAGEGDLRAELAALIEKTRAPARLVGALDRESLANALAAADVVAIPSVVDRAGNVDGLPNSLLEALAAGKAVVASRVAGIPDVVEDGVTGLLLPPGDSAALAAALELLRREPETRARLARGARQLALRRLSWAEAARGFEESYVQAAALAAR